MTLFLNLVARLPGKLSNKLESGMWPSIADTLVSVKRPYQSTNHPELASWRVHNNNIFILYYYC